MKKIAGIIFGLFSVAFFAPSVFAGGGAPGRVTGGGTWSAGATQFTLAISGQVKHGKIQGQMEYNREGQNIPDLKLHANVECMSFWGPFDEAVMGGPVNVQYDPSGLVNEGDWMIVALKEDGVGPGDMSRVRVLPESQAIQTCYTQETSFPGVMTGGNINISEMAQWAN